MAEACIQHFFIESDPNCMDRHSDSSDFEVPSRPTIVPKVGNHKLLKKKVKKCKAERDYDMDAPRNNTENCELHSRRKYKQSLSKSQIYKNDPSFDRYKKSDSLPKSVNKEYRDDQNLCYEGNSRFLIKNKILPCLSTILRRSNNTEYLNNIKEKHTDKDIKSNTLQNPNSNSKIKDNIRNYKYESQHVYPVRETYNISTRLKSTKSKESLNTCTISSISASEEEVKNYKYEKKLQNTAPSKNNSKEIYNKNENKINKEYNKSKEHPNSLNSQRGRPYQVFTSSCQTDESANAKGITTESTLCKLDANSSAFWNFLIGKVHKKYLTHNIDNSKECNCVKPEPCNNDTCEYRDNSMEAANSHQPDLDLQNHLKMTQPPFNIPSGNFSTLRGSNPSIKSKKEKKDVDCQCHSENKDLKNTTLLNGKTSSNGKTSPSSILKKPCQEDHDMIIKEIAAKYNGEILCIHNPPCILINGCINVPDHHNVIQAHYCPTTQSKKSNFSQMCKKMKRNKQKCSEQGCQYHPPYSDIAQCLPEFRTDKNIQSNCNHNPTCQYVHECYKPRFNQESTYLCTHVPTCQTLPYCIIDGILSNQTCTHDPKCKELPVCLKNQLAEKESIGTQVKLDSCQHVPPCVRIPMCLAQLISIQSPFEIVPSVQGKEGEIITACFLKSVKDDTSASSRAPPANCRIV